MTAAEKRYALDAADILGIEDVLEEDVEVPEWGGITVRIRGLTGDERDRYEESLVQGKGQNATVNMRGARARLIAMTAVKPDGSKLFSVDDAKKLGQKSGKATNRLWEVAQRLSGLRREDIDELTGNSDPDPSD